MKGNSTADKKSSSPNPSNVVDITASSSNSARSSNFAVAVGGSAGTTNDSGNLAAKSEGNEEDAKASKDALKGKIAAAAMPKKFACKNEREVDDSISVGSFVDEKMGEASSQRRTSTRGNITKVKTYSEVDVRRDGSRKGEEDGKREGRLKRGNDDDDDNDFVIANDDSGDEAVPPTMKKRKTAVKKATTSNADVKENVHPQQRKASSTALGSHPFIDTINSRKCCTPKCDALIHAHIYTENDEKRYCYRCFKTAISLLTEAQRSLHEAKKVLRLKAKWEQFGKSIYIDGAPLDEHIHSFADDPELPSILFTNEGPNEGLLTMLAGFLPKLLELLQAKGFKLKTGRDLILCLMNRYDVLPDESICVKEHGPDDGGQIKLLEGLENRDISLWFREYERDEHGKLKFGMSREALDKDYEVKEKLKARKAAVARGESEGAGDTNSSWTSTDVHSMCSGLKKKFSNAKLHKMTDDDAKSIVANRGISTMSEQCRRLFGTQSIGTLLKNKDFQAAAAGEAGAAAVLLAAKGKKKKNKTA
mmetsp:Transcript_10858/g.16383  ORF Transcript_10858/g.16383 Transcript_10858/m.16383 type:complete len:534 (-) Transcript_10858:37-1638(-)|eukprot:scaffold2273_cov76-Skeletonema_dohrnii-CCMP3373.AAC.2